MEQAESDARKRHFLISFVYYVLVLALAYLFLKYLLGWVLPFLLAFLLAALLQPPVRWMRRKTGMSLRFCGVTLTLLVLLALLALCVFCASRLVAALGDLTRLLPQFTSQLSAALLGLSARLSELAKNIPQSAGLAVDTSLAGVTRQIVKLTSLEDGAGSFVQGFLRFLPLMLVDCLTAAVAACFIAADYPGVSGFLLRQLPERHRRTALGLKNFFLTTMAGLIRAYLKLMLITFGELTVGLLLLRVRHAVAVAALIALVDVLPVLGTGTVMIPWAAVEFLLGRAGLGFGIAALYGVVTVARNILEPKIVGRHVGLHPLVTLAAMFVGFKALGLLGMLVLPLGVLMLRYLRESGLIHLWKD